MTDNGLWQLDPAISEWDRWRGEELLMNDAAHQEAVGLKRAAERSAKGARILGRTAVSPEGCMTGGLRGRQSAAEWVIRFAEREWGAPAFTTEEELAEVRSCDNDECYNSRHYEFDFSRPTLKERKIDIRPEQYYMQQDGSIVTVWGDRLPSIGRSLDYFMEFQRRNYPFVPLAKSRLTPGSMSQIGFHPLTGCWESWQYYCKPDDNVNWQFDGYGRLYQRFTVTEIDYDTGEVTRLQRRGHWLAHRVVWAASGRRLIKNQVLNHRCGYRRCCNPLHIEQVDHATNIIHGRRMQRAIRALPDNQIDPQLHRQALRQAAQEVLMLYRNAAAP